VLDMLADRIGDVEAGGRVLDEAASPLARLPTQLLPAPGSASTTLISVGRFPAVDVRLGERGSMS
jgi:hypothetical protein